MLPFFYAIHYHSYLAGVKPATDHQTPREILTTYYAENKFGDDGGISSPNVKIELTKGFHFYFPNFDARKKVVLKHDIHHLVTEYSTSLKGECEISMWEIASGCKKYRFAFFIDIPGVMISQPFNFFPALRAFARGRRTKNMYHDLVTNEQALDMTIGDLRRLFHLDIYPVKTKPSLTDFLLFAGFFIFGFVYSLVLMATLPFIVVYSIWVALKVGK